MVGNSTVSLIASTASRTGVSARRGCHGSLIPARSLSTAGVRDCERLPGHHKTYLWVGVPRNDRVDRPPPVPAPPPVLPLAARECPAGLVTVLQHSGAPRQPRRSAKSGSHALDGLGERGLARTEVQP